MKAAEFYAKDRAAWRRWLEENYDKEQSVWLFFDKGSSRVLAWEDIVQEALCFGWIDSRPGKVSETQSKIYVSRRRPKSVWSKINKTHVEEMISKKLMTHAGQQVIDQAKKDGSWDALNKSDNLELPPKLKQMLNNNSKAKEFFNQMTPSAKRVALEWIYAAKTLSTQQKRIEQTVSLAAQGHKTNQYSKKA